MSFHIILNRAPLSPTEVTMRTIVAVMITLTGIILATLPTPSYAQEGKAENKGEMKSNEKKTDAEPMIEAPIAERVKVDWQKTEMSNMKTLAKTLPDGKELWLGNGDERFLAVYQEANTPTPTGAVIILHDNGRHARWPQTTATISDTLPDYGWTTLTVSLPRADKAPQPPRPTPMMKAAPEEAPQEDNKPELMNEKSQETATEQSVENKPVMSNEAMKANNSMAETGMKNTTKASAEDITSGRLFVAYEYLTQQGMLNVVISGNGLGAPRAAKLIQDMPTPESPSPDIRPAKPIAALIIVNAENQIATSDSELTQALSNPSLPVLDVFFGSDTKTLKEAKHRKQHANRYGLEVYQQLKLPLLNNQLSLGENTLSKRIRGFINRHAKGRTTTLR